jgi:hypothetical protein
MLEISRKQQKSLVDQATADPAATAAVLEPLLVSLQKSEEEKTKLLQRLGTQNLVAAIGRYPDSLEQDMAFRLLAKLQSVMSELQSLSGQSQELLKRNMQYIDFNINVVTRTTTGTTYGASGGQPTQSDGAVKMFDTNI